MSIFHGVPNPIPLLLHDSLRKLCHLVMGLDEVLVRHFDAAMQ